MDKDSAAPPGHPSPASGKPGSPTWISVGSLSDRFELHDKVEELPIWDEEWSFLRQWVCQVIQGKPFETFMAFVIMGNLLLVMVETDRRAVCRREERSSSDSCEANTMDIRGPGFAMLIIYVIEMLLRVWVYRSRFHHFFWNMFDATIVSVSVLGEVFGGIIANLAVMRIFRMMRLVRIFRMLTAYRELYLIIHGFASTMRIVLWASLLLVLLLSLVSMVAVEVLDPVAQELSMLGEYEDCERCPEMFSGVWRANLTFFQILIMADDWAQVSMKLIEFKPWTSLVLMGAVVLVYLGFNNLIIGVIVEKAAEAREQDDLYKSLVRRDEEERAKRTLFELCGEIDLDGSGELTVDELQENCVNNTKFIAQLTRLNVETEDLQCVFQIMDADHSGTVTYEEFTDTLVKLKRGDVLTQLGFIKFHVVQMKVSQNQELASVRGMCGDMLHEIAALRGERPRTPWLKGPLREAEPPLSQHEPEPEQRGSRAPPVVASSAECLQGRLSAICSQVEVGVQKLTEQTRSDLLSENTRMIASLNRSLEGLLESSLFPAPKRALAPPGDEPLARESTRRSNAASREQPPPESEDEVSGGPAWGACVPGPRSCSSLGGARPPRSSEASAGGGPRHV